MPKSTSKISWKTMLDHMQVLGHFYTGEYLFLPKGYKRKQPIYRFEYNGAFGTKRLSVEELKKEFNGEVTILQGFSEYCPECKYILMTNRIYSQN